MQRGSSKPVSSSTEAVPQRRRLLDVFGERIFAEYLFTIPVLCVGNYS